MSHVTVLVPSQNGTEGFTLRTLTVGETRRCSHTTLRGLGRIDVHCVAACV